ncbi:MAG: hypothetical protein NZ853_01550 [Leptospiraceae bacterium]|nr:hypothetical protein [Leptospiraceae bacterium]MDW7976087.1 hypothetical protein [Leptospiraceae bacterium]
MDEFEFDRTRKAIGVNKLQEEEKKKLLKMFQEKGGKVLKEKMVKKEQSTLLHTRTQTDKSDRREVKSIYERYEQDSLQKESEKIAREKIERDEILKKASSPLSIFLLKLELWLKGIIYFGKNEIKPSYMSFLNLEFKKSILESNILTSELLTDPKFIEEFKKKFQPFSLELLKRVNLLYDRKQLSDLTSVYSESGGSVSVDLIRTPLFHFLRKLYVLSFFRELTLKLLLSCIDLQQSIQQKQIELYRNKRRKIEEAWAILMNKALPDFILLAQFIEKKRVPSNSPLLQEIIDLSPTELLDPRKIRDFKDVVFEHVNLDQKKSNQTAETNTEIPTTQSEISQYQTEEQKENTAQIPQDLQETTINQNIEVDSKDDKKDQAHQKVYQYGLRFLLYYPVDVLRKKYDPKDEFKLIPINDKIFLSFLFLNFFDEEFGFVLLTNKIQIQPYWKEGVKINLKEEMSNLYESYRIIERSFRKYFNDFIAYLEVKNDPYVNKNTIDYRKRLDFHTKKRIQSAIETHKVMSNYIKKSTQILLTLYKDTKEKQQVITNPDDVLQLEHTDKKEKLMNNKKVRDVIRDAYATAYTLTYKMEQGELYVGEVELPPEEFQIHYKRMI